MKTLKMKLEDGKNYVLRTLPFTKSNAIRKKMKSRDPKVKRYEHLSKKEEEHGLSVEELEELVGLEVVGEKLEEDLTDVMLRAVAASLSVHNEQFRLNDNESDHGVLSKVEELFNLPDLQIAFNFAISGTIGEVDANDLKSEIDLTGETDVSE